MEYINAGSLAYILQRFGPFPETLVAIYIKQVLTGLEYLHSQGITHGNIKGANILSTQEGLVKLTNFGVVINANQDKKDSYWTAPEIIEAKAEENVSNSCDIWSLGCTVIELTCGSPPYFDLDAMSASMRIVKDECPPLPNIVSKNCNDFLLKCFDKDPAARIEAKELLKHPWLRN